MRRVVLLHRHDFDVHQTAHLVLGLKKLVDGIESLRVKILLSTLTADLRLDILDDVELALQPGCFFTVFFSVLPPQNSQIISYPSPCPR